MGYQVRVWTYSLICTAYNSRLGTTYTMYSYQRCMHVHLAWDGRGAYHIREQGCWSKSA